MSMPSFEVRPAVAADTPFILSLVPRFVEFGPPPWRNLAARCQMGVRGLGVH